MRVRSPSQPLAVFAACLGLGLTAGPAAAQTGTGTSPGAFTNLPADQLAAAQTALSSLSQATGLSTARLTQLVNSGGSGVIPTLTLTPSQQTAAAAALQQLATAVGVPASQLAGSVGVTLPAAGTGNTGSGTGTGTGTGTTGTGTAGTGTTTGRGTTTGGTGAGGQTQGGGAGTAQPTATTAARTAENPPGPARNGARIPPEEENYLQVMTLYTMDVLDDLYGLDFPNQVAAFQFYTDLFDQYAVKAYGPTGGYQGPGITYWLVKYYGLPR